MRGGGHPGGWGPCAWACSQAAQGGVRVRPAKGVGSRWGCGRGHGGSGVVGHTAAGVAWPRPMEHDAQPHQGDQHQLGEKERRYHGKTPSYKSCNEGILPGFSGYRMSRRIEVHDLLSGKIDYARAIDPVTARKVQATPGMTSTDFYQSVIRAAWVNTEKKPFNDPRVRRALHLVLDKHALAAMAKDVSPSLVGGFLYPFAEFGTPAAKLAERLGYQADPSAAIHEARQLLAAAGYPKGLKNVDSLVREAPILHLWAAAMQAMLRESLNIETNLRTVQISVWFDDAQAGNFDLTLGAIVSTLLDPSDYFNAWDSK